MTLNIQTLPVTVQIRAWNNFYNISSIYEWEGIFYLQTPFLLDNYYSLCTIIIFAYVFVCIIIQAKFRPHLYGRTNVVHNSVCYAWLGNLN